MLPQALQTISDIVRTDYRTADVFKKHNINYCCSGQVSLQEACALRQMDYDMLLTELKQATRTISLPNNLKFDEWSVPFLIDYIINVHHAYVYQAVPSLQARLTSFMHAHQKKHPQLQELNTTFNQLALIVTAHSQQEEEIIFPYIKQIETAYRKKESYGSLLVRTLRKPLSNIEKEHHTMHGLLKKLANLTNDFTPPEKACTNHQVVYHQLKAFYNDMLQHKHLENNILFPKAADIEKSLL